MSIKNKLVGRKPTLLIIFFKISAKEEPPKIPLKSEKGSSLQEKKIIAAFHQFKMPAPMNCIKESTVNYSEEVHK